MSIRNSNVIVHIVIMPKLVVKSFELRTLYFKLHIGLGDMNILVLNHDLDTVM